MLTVNGRRICYSMIAGGSITSEREIAGHTVEIPRNADMDWVKQKRLAIGRSRGPQTPADDPHHQHSGGKDDGREQYEKPLDGKW